MVAIFVYTCKSRLLLMHSLLYQWGVLAQEPVQSCYLKMCTNSFVAFLGLSPYGKSPQDMRPHALRVIISREDHATYPVREERLVLPHYIPPFREALSHKCQRKLYCRHKTKWRDFSLPVSHHPQKKSNLQCCPRELVVLR